LEAIYVKQNEYDKALEVGEKALANDPNDVEVAYNGLKAAEGKEDPTLVKTWSARTSQNARKAIAASKPPADDDEKQALKYIKGLDTYSEYALYALAVKLKDPKQRVELGAALEQQNVKSQYMPVMSGIYLNALTQSGQSGKTCSTAEKLAGANSKDADALVVAANCNLQQSHFDRAVVHATHAIEAISSKPKPEGLSDAEWASRKAMQLGRANFVAGVGYGAQSRFGPADKALRSALPSLKGDNQSTALALFYLGLSNYNLGKAVGDKAKTREGLHYFEQCAEISSTVQDQASKNVRTIRAELGIVK
jgi:tetratricopeptide (TPR) repeat protein